MSHLQTLELEHLPEDFAVHIALYENVKNAAFLQQQLLQGNTAFEYAFIDASVIVSSTHLLAAIFRAANDKVNDRLKSKNVHSEVVFCLSMNNNIAESFRRFGVSPATTSLYAIKLSTTPSVTASTVQQHLLDSIEGNPVPFSDVEIAKFTDIGKVRKAYKLSDTRKKPGGGSGKGLENSHSCSGEAERSGLEGMVLGLMALRGAT
ncbi:MAG: hypothetical protein LQ339_003741 [Xanthoria mediterranea]|nr:MAG: hypothetical protein LQ339_003741 [Xanthoria mediterranea]